MEDLLRSVQEGMVRKDLPDFGPGDTIRVYFRIKEGDRDKVQPFEGVVISRRGSGTSETITVRRVSYGVGIERIFPLHSPRLERIEVLRKGKVRRAKLYYLREKSTKEARIEEKREF